MNGLSVINLSINYCLTKKIVEIKHLLSIMVFLFLPGLVLVHHNLWALRIDNTTVFFVRSRSLFNTKSLSLIAFCILACQKVFSVCFINNIYLNGIGH